MVSPATRRTALIVLAVTVCAAGLVLWRKRVARNAFMARRVYDLGPVGLRAHVDGDLLVEVLHGEVQLTLGPGTRSPTALVVATSPAAASPDRPSSLTTECGLRVNYAVRREEGGSGGAQATVTGTLRLSRRRLPFTCRSQAEFGTPEGGCLELLDALCE